MAVAKIYNENTGQWEAAITGPSGVIDVTSPITNTGTPTEANIGISDATPTAVGVVKGKTTDNEAIALGEDALVSKTTATNLTAVGYKALELNTTGGANSAFGHQALRDNITGSNNSAFGRNALVNNEDGNENNAFGSSALQNNTTGQQNNAQGASALRDNTSGGNNTAIGRAAAQSNITGDENTAIGSLALLANNTGVRNVAIGRLSMASTSTSVSYNTGVGWSSLQLSTGNFNTAIGYEAGKTIDSGTNNSFLGTNSQPSSITVSNEITLGDSNITSLRCNVQSISSLSDERDKTNIQDSPLGLDLIQRLRPVTFDWDRRDGSFAGRKDVGFIAQDVVEVEDELDIEDTLRMSYRENPEKLEVAPARLIPVLTKAIQELSEQNAELKARLDKLEGK